MHLKLRLKRYLIPIYYLGWPLSLDRGIVSSEYSSRSHLSDWHKTFTFWRFRASQFIDFVKKKIFFLICYCYCYADFLRQNLSVECLSYYVRKLSVIMWLHGKKIITKNSWSPEDVWCDFFFTEGWTWRKLRNFSMTAMKIEVNTSNVQPFFNVRTIFCKQISNI